MTCPVTTQVKGGAFEVAVPKTNKLTGVVLSDHVRSLDWLARRAEFHSKASDEVVDEVVARVVAVISTSA
jgi:mRNA interferase MazF